MGSSLKYTTFLDTFDQKHASEFGLTSKRLYDLTQLDIHVPNSFFVSSRAFDDFVHSNNMRGKIIDNLMSVDINNSKELEKIAKVIQNEILNAEVPAKVKDEISIAYSRLSGFSPSLVSVSYSPINEDLDYSVFTEERFQYLNIKGEADLIDSIKKIWATIFDPRAIFYREAKRYTGILTIAVVVQKLPFAESSGILFTSDPTTNDSGSAQVEAILGVIDPLLSSEIQPDIYNFDKEKGEIIARNTVTQDWMLVRKGRVRTDEESNAKVSISPAYKKLQKLSDYYIDYLGKLSVVLEKYSSKPIEAQWQLETGRISIASVRPMVTLKIKDSDWKFAPTVTALKSKLSNTKNEVEEVGKVKKEIDFEKSIEEASENIADKVLAPEIPEVIVNVPTKKEIFTTEKKSKTGEKGYSRKKY